MGYRKLTTTEIEVLERQGCRAENWNEVLAKEGFSPDRVVNVRFGGQVRLGVLRGTIEISDGITKPSGLSDCFIQDSTIGDNVYISDVKNLVRYDVAENVAIEAVGNIVMVGASTFGNGVRIAMLNESGGRENPLFDRITAQMAYMLVTYRHDTELIERLNSLVDEYVETKKSTRGTIGAGARITNSTFIKNVYVGPHAKIEGALLLEEGTIASNEHDPIHVGEGVIVKEFLFLSGSRVDGASVVDRCFVGQGVKIGKQYSTENSGFFANSECFHGEAVSVFAGPYTVTHHKSTLLIAGLFSFYNAGSGSNQSNHMYKLGPVHQGILGRGAKTGSFSYLVWPCRIGVFTGVIGKHYANFDTSNMPFSYILESEGKSLLMPAMNLTTVGTRRDSTKWPNRDRRKDPQKLDLLNFELFSPYTIGHILQGIDDLKELDAISPEEEALVRYNGTFIKRNKIKQAIQSYELAVKIFLGDQLATQLSGCSDTSSFEAVVKKLNVNRPEALGRWIDMAGMLAPRAAIQQLLDAIHKGQVKSLDDLADSMRVLHEDYDSLAWAWSVDLIEKRLGLDFKIITKKHMVNILNDWKESKVRFNEMILEDAQKEFSEKSRIGYGLDGGVDEKNKDFEAVLGKYEENSFVKGLLSESDEIQKRADDLIRLIESL